MKDNLSPIPQEEEAEIEVSLRPRTFDEYIGQKGVKEKLTIFVEAARKRNEPLDHALFCGPPGLGKTSLAYIMANELKCLSYHDRRRDVTLRRMTSYRLLECANNWRGDICRVEVDTVGRI